MSPLLSALLSLSFLPALAAALTYQNLWNLPDGDKSDLSQTFSYGQSLPLSWQALNASTDDLWVTTFNYNEVQYSSLITQDIDISVDGTYTWTVKIPSDQLSKSAKYVLRFKPAASPRTSYDIDSVEISSPGFLVLNAAAASSASTSTTTKASSSTSTASIPATSLVTTLSTTTSPSPTTAAPAVETTVVVDEETLSVGAKAGIGVGVSVGAIAVAGAIAWICISRRRKSAATDSSQYAPHPYNLPSGQEKRSQDAWTAPEHQIYLAELPGRGHYTHNVSELPGDSRNIH